MRPSACAKAVHCGETEAGLSGSVHLSVSENLNALLMTFLLLFGLMASTAFAFEGDTASGTVHIDVEAEPAELLSTYNLFRDAKRQIPNEGVIPYDLNTPHFADYAALHRFVWMPDGSSCEYGPEGEIEFPVGSVLVITMGYKTDFRNSDLGEHIVETRLWMRRSSGWIGAQYAWNDDTTEARLAVAGEKIDVSWTHTDGEPRHHTFRVPNRNQCIQCHEINEQLIPLGPIHARYLNRTYPYEQGERNQLEFWEQVGFLKGLPEQREDIPRMAVWDDPSTGDVDSRARAYLDMNCSSCHRKGGIGFTSGLDLRYDQREPVKFGVFKAPVAAGRGAGNGRFVIEPGHPDRSILLYRLKSTDPGVRMPVVGRSIAHDEGVALITQWIAEMDYPELVQRQREVDQRGSLNPPPRDVDANSPEESGER
ncbi:MAG: hypothetical protein KDA93_06905 [Planctomycetaceae bacterium]|nr:hypothetical protein [Planctomycetaceae bacterium]